MTAVRVVPRRPIVVPLTTRKIRLRVLPGTAAVAASADAAKNAAAQAAASAQEAKDYVDLVNMNELSIGTVTDGPTADATITGQAPNQVLNLVLPSGDDGAAATIAVGTVTTVDPGDPATVTNIGTSSAAVFDFGIPKGLDGVDGEDGALWYAGASDPSSGTGQDGDFYLQTGNGSTGILGDVWEKAAGSWSVVGNIRGAAGSGSGDMLAATYDPQNIAADAFDRTKHTGKMPLNALDDSPVIAFAVGRLGTSGDLGAVQIASSHTQATLAYRGTGGTLAVGTPTTSNHATTKDYVDAALSAKADTSSLGNAAFEDTGTGAGKVPILDSDGKLDVSTIPAVAITDTFVVNSQAAMLALDAERGDIAIRTDLNKSFVLQTDDPTTLADWKELLTPTDAVLSVAGLTGTISDSALKTALAIAQADVSGLTTSSIPQFSGLQIGHASDTTLTRSSAGNLAVEGKLIYRADGTDVPVADGGTGASDAAGARTNLGIGSMAERAVTISTSDPSGGADGDVWLKYTP